ncbi:MAG: hypothetical protein RLO52_30605 [Sandaracinaceae bacterium]
MGLLRTLLAAGFVLAFALLQSEGGCGGYEPEPRKGEGDPCTRTDECQSHLECSGGVCREPFEPELDSGLRDSGAAPSDSGVDPADAGGERDASTAGDAGPDSGAFDGG